MRCAYCASLALSAGEVMNRVIKIVENTKELQESHEIMRNGRGAFIDQMCWIDWITSEILTLFFVQDEERRKLFRSDLVGNNGISVNKKIDLLAAIPFQQLEISPDLISSLRGLNQFRNKLAHAQMDTSANYMATFTGKSVDKVNFLYWQKSEEKSLEVTIREFDQKLKDCSDCMQKLHAIYATLSNA